MTVKSGGMTVATCTTAGVGGCCTVDVHDAGDYEVKVELSGYYTYDLVRTLACNATYTIKLSPNSSNAPVEFDVAGCCALALPGATVTIGGVSYTTDAAGKVKLGLTTTGTYSWSIAKSRFVTKTGSFSITECFGRALVGWTMQPDTGYACAPACGTTGLVDPIPTTALSFTDSIWGGGTAAYDAVNQWWTGTVTATYNAAAHGYTGQCPDPTTFTLTYRFFGCGGVGVSWPYRACGNCIGASFQSNGSVIPSDALPPCQTGDTQITVFNPVATGSVGSSDPGWTCSGGGTIPLANTWTVPSYATGVGHQIYPAGSTISLTE